MKTKATKNTPVPELTDFGFQNVTKTEKKRKVDQVFNAVATQYDLMNDLMSLGIHRWWKYMALQYSGACLGQKILDVACGTGDLALPLSRLVGPTGFVVLVDINAAMLTVGRSKLRDQGAIGNLHYVQADAEKLPFPDNCFDCVTLAFGLRNITNKEQALHALLRVLKPGGRLLILEFSQPINPLLNKLYDLYSFELLPRLGQWIVGDGTSYRYLVESIRRHPNQQQLQRILYSIGFQQVEYFNLSGGIVALHRGYKF